MSLSWEHICLVSTCLITGLTGPAHRLSTLILEGLQNYAVQIKTLLVLTLCCQDHLQDGSMTSKSTSVSKYLVFQLPMGPTLGDRQGTETFKMLLFLYLPHNGNNSSF